MNAPLPMIAPPRAMTAATPSDLLRIAVESGADLDRLERLMALQERWEATEARKAFTVAMTAFKAEPLTVFKRQTVDFTSAKGRTHYKHATLSDVTAAVAPAMSKHALSFRWDVRQEAKQVTVECIVTHAAGHSERVSMSGPMDDTGNKNAIQQAGSTVTYLQRYTLLAVVGLSTQEETDDDGTGGPEESTDELDAFRAAAMEGVQALRARYEAHTPAESFWKSHGPSLRAAAMLADKDRARRADEDRA